MFGMPIISSIYFLFPISALVSPSRLFIYRQGDITFLLKVSICLCPVPSLMLLCFNTLPCLNKRQHIAMLVLAISRSPEQARDGKQTHSNASQATAPTGVKDEEGGEKR